MGTFYRTNGDNEAFQIGNFFETHGKNGRVQIGTHILNVCYYFTEDDTIYCKVIGGEITKI